ncbi:MAG: ABC transporter substrate-binding protein [Pseudomonadota bacterium]
MKIGVSGHRYRDAADWEWTRRAIVDVFIEHPTAVGWSSIAVGADQIFAEAALVFGRGLVAVIPAYESYAEEFSGRDRRVYDMTLARAKKVIRVSEGAREAAFLRAGQKIVRNVDLMALVWDGAPAQGAGGTADIVDCVRQLKSGGQKMIDIIVSGVSIMLVKREEFSAFVAANGIDALLDRLEQEVQS